MKKLIVVVVLLAFAPILVPAKADALTLRQRVSRLEGRIKPPAQSSRDSVQRFRRVRRPGRRA